jgi:hypothetical protein
MSEFRVVMTSRPPSGRKRHGGQYRWFRKKGNLPAKPPAKGLQKSPTRVEKQAQKERLYASDRELAERLAGAGWQTAPQIAASIGTSRNAVSCRLRRIRLYGASEYILRRRVGEQRCAGYGADGAPGRNRLVEYQVEKAPAKGLQKSPTGVQVRGFAERMAGSGWRTLKDLIADSGIGQASVYLRLQQLREGGAPEYVLRQRYGTGRFVEYHIEKARTADADDLSHT